MAKKKQEQLDELREYYDTHDTSADMEGGTWEEPEPVAEPMVTHALRLPQPVLDQLRSVADSRGLKVTALMREWLEERLARESELGDVTISASALLAFVAERTAQARPRAS
jgi:hypothetical protein